MFKEVLKIEKKYVQEILSKEHILQDFPKLSIEKYYIRKYLPDYKFQQPQEQNNDLKLEPSEYNDIYIYHHPNGLSIVGITQAHKFFHNNSIKRNQGRNTEYEGSNNNRQIIGNLNEKYSGYKQPILDVQPLQCQQNNLQQLKQDSQFSIDFTQLTLNLAPKKKKLRKDTNIYLNPGDTICEIKQSSKVYSIQCPLKGVLIEYNQRLVENPEILFKRPHDEAFLFIVSKDPKVEQDIGISAREYAALRNLQYQDLI